MFSKQNTQVVKGIAILMMLFHHCFLAGRYDGYTISFLPLAESQVVNVATFFKICVSLFAFVSGYGLFLSYEKTDPKKTANWLWTRYIKTCSGFWFVVILAWVVGMLIDQRPYHVYGFESSIPRGICNAVADFLGVGRILGIGKLSEDWWYMSAAVAFILFVPLLAKSLDRFGGVCTLGIMTFTLRALVGYPDGVSFLSFLPVFCLGMVFAKYDLFSRWDLFWKGRNRRVFAKYMRFFVLLLAVFVGYKLYYHLPNGQYWDFKLTAIPLAVILFSNDYISRIPIVSHVLVFLGKQSANMFWIHTFFRLYYCKDFVYGMHHFIAVVLVLLALSLLASLLVEMLKKLTRYNNFVNATFRLSN